MSQQKDNLPRGASPLSTLVPVFIILGLTLLIYSNTFTYSFHFDDEPSILSNPHIKHLFHIGDLWRYWPTRVVTYLTVALNYSIGTLNVTGYHIVNILIHIITGILVYSLVLLTFKTPRVRALPLAAHAPSIAFFTSLIFISHPLQTEAVTYIIQRATSLATLFYIGSVTCYVQARLTKKPLFFILCLISIIAAMFSKEMTVTLPFVILLYEYTFFTEEGKRRDLKGLIPILVTVLIIPCTMFFTHSVDFTAMKRIAEPSPDTSSYHYLLTQARVIMTYIRLLFVPINQTLDYDYRISKSLVEPTTLISLLLILSIISVALLRYKKHRLISFSLLFFFITLIPESSIVPIRDIIYEHRLYLPMFGFSLFLTTASFMLLDKKRASLLLIAIITVFSMLTYMRNFVWKDELTLWDDAVRKAPHGSRAYYNRANAYADKGQNERAIVDYDMVLRINPLHDKAYNNRATMYLRLGDYEKAITGFRTSVTLNQKNAEAFSNRGNAYARQGQFEKAIVDYDRAIALRPDFAEAYNNRGAAYTERKDFARALADYNKAIEFAPTYANAYHNRAAVYYFQKEYDKAWADVHKVYALGSDVAANLLSSLRVASGRER